MTKFKPLHGVVFFLILVFAAVIICVRHGKNVERQNAEKAATEEKERAVQIAHAEQERTVAMAAEKEQMKVREAEAERQKYLGYINTNITRLPGEQLIAAVCISETGSMNLTIASALATRFQRGPVKVTSSFFRPTLISDGLFEPLSNGSKDLFNKLELEKSLDGLLLARQEVQYSKNEALNGVITATMHVQITTLPVASSLPGQSWTLSSNGAGFNKSDARIQAEERILKQIADDKTFILSNPTP